MTRYAPTAGQDPQAVAEACVRQVRRAVARPETRVAVIEALRPYTRGTGHNDLNGEKIAEAIQQLCRAITFYREPAGQEYPGEVVQSPTVTLAINGGDCDDIAVVAATAAKVFGCEAAIGWTEEPGGGNFAHIVAAIRPGWYQPKERWIVIDAQKEKPASADRLSAHWLGV